RRLGDVRANDGAFSPDGKHIVYSMGSDIFQTNLDGTESRKLVSVSGTLIFPRFSPDGSLLRFTTDGIWEVRSDGTGLRRFLPDWNGRKGPGCGSWTPDGRYYVFQAVGVGTKNSNLWALREKGGLLGSTSREPVQLTAGPLDFHLPVPSPDGRKLYAI